MNIATPHHPDRPNETGWYQIAVQGRLDPRWAIRFDGMAMSHREGYTILQGPVVDQAALHGLLHQLRDTGLTLVSVNRTLEPTHDPQ
jgi:hypothetical protein